MINMSDHLLGSWGWRAGSRQILGEACLCPQSQTVLLDSHPHPTMNEEGKAPPPFPYHTQVTLKRQLDGKVGCAFRLSIHCAT